jgi:Fe-Mn family superoxide dismutase
MLTRREAIKTTALAAAATAVAPSLIAQTNAPAPAAAAPFTLPPLPYAVDALEPHIDARTMEIHHDRHHKAYVDNLNKAVAEMPHDKMISLGDLIKNLDSAPEKVRAAVRNNGGGHYNHSLFWQMMKKDVGGEPKAELAKAIDSAFGSVAAFKEGFAKAALGRFGSGWAWLVFKKGKLEIVTTANQDSPLMGEAVAGCDGRTLLGLDVWEHAYYLKYQNKRADYITAWWNVVNWDFVTERYLKAKG